MKKHMKIPVVFESLDHAQESALFVKFDRGALRDWCLGLCLLHERLIDTLVVSNESGQKSVEINVVWTAERGTRVQAELNKEKALMKVTETHLGYLLEFFLTYYRDGVAAVDHVDLQADIRGTKNKNGYIVFKVPDFVPPVTPEEAERRLRGL